MAGVYRSRGGASRGAQPRSRVVSRGRGRELRVRGTFASYYEPGSAITGSVWDAIGAALLALPESRRRRVLLLGLGGGSAARVVRAIAPRAHIVGVEIDPEVVRLARSHFDLDRLGIDVVVDDALAFLARSRGRFDAVLEDVFVGSDRDVHKPPAMLHPGLERAARRVAPGGVLASNSLDEWRHVSRALHELFPSQVRIAVEDYDNRVYVASRRRLSAGSLRQAVGRSPVLAPTLPALRFRTERRG